MSEMSSLQVGEAAGPTGSCREPIDHAHLARYTMGNVALEHEVLGLFADQSQILVDNLAEATSPKDWKMYAHTLKGSARAVGAWEVGMAAECAERLPPDCDARTRSAAITALRDELQVATAYIAQVIGR